MSTFIFGDSFVGAFKLIDDPNLRVFKFKGGALKGLLKDDNENRINIINTLNASDNVKYAIFMLGTVDVNFSYFYNKYVLNKETDYGFVKDYVNFISTLKAEKKIIIGVVVASWLKDEYAREALYAYGIIPKEIKMDNDDEDFKAENRYKRLIEFNNLLEKYCKEYGVLYVDFNKELIDNDTKMIKRKYSDTASLYNVHVLWERCIIVYINYLNKLGVNLPFKFRVNLEESLKKYFITKKKELDEKFPDTFTTKLNTSNIDSSLLN